MILNFTKMHGLGNDFVVFDAINQQFQLTTDQVRLIADRHFGVGCDQILLVEPWSGEDADFRYRIFNADGGEVEQCGNGARCFARFVVDQGLTQKRSIPVMTAAGKIILHLLTDGQVSVDMGIPVTLPSSIPFQTDNEQSTYLLSMGDTELSIGAVSMGNPHAVTIVDDIDTAPVESLGARLESHPRFPERVNVGFMQIMNEKNIRLRVFERGAGETLACGTGACAAVVSGIIRKKLANDVKVELPGGQLSVQWNGVNEPVIMTGPAKSVFTGTIDL